MAIANISFQYIGDMFVVLLLSSPSCFKATTTTNKALMFVLNVNNNFASFRLTVVAFEQESIHTMTHIFRCNIPFLVLNIYHISCIVAIPICCHRKKSRRKIRESQSIQIDWNIVEDFDGGYDGYFPGLSVTVEDNDNRYFCFIAMPHRKIFQKFQNSKHAWMKIKRLFFQTENKIKSAEGKQTMP